MQKIMSDQMKECIENCKGCHDICLQTITHCLREGGRHAGAEHVRLLMDCAEICQTSADFMTRGSDLHTSACAACADVCDKCADSCDQMGEDPAMKACADACRRCAASCREMAAALV